MTGGSERDRASNMGSRPSATLEAPTPRLELFQVKIRWRDQSWCSDTVYVGVEGSYGSGMVAAAGRLALDARLGPGMDERYQATVTRVRQLGVVYLGARS